MSRTLLKGLGLLIALVILGAMWRYLQQQGLLTQAHLEELTTTISQWQQAPWMFAAVIAVYISSLLVMFPLSLLVVLTGLLFGPVWGLISNPVDSRSSTNCQQNQLNLPGINEIRIF